MQVRRISPARWAIYVFTLLWLLVVLPLSVAAAPYADHVIDARTGEVLHSQNADTRLHPASLTKMMTLYITFEAIKNGEITLDTLVTVSQNAASEPPSKLGLKSGQKIAVRYLIRAAAVKSANDAATALGEAVGGSEAAFARRMNRTAKALGMTRTTFKNANGLTEEGHLSTARDMTTLGRHLLYDYPQYYNLFSRRSTDAGGKTVANTNRRLLSEYEGADGIKTGYTRAAGFNLVASAQRGNERIIATVFGGSSTVSRNAKVAELLDLGFRRAPSKAPLRMPDGPAYVASADPETAPTSDRVAAGKTIRVAGTVQTSLRPKARPGVTQAVVATARENSGQISADIAALVAEVAAPPTVSTTTTATATAEATEEDEETVVAAVVAEAGETGLTAALRPTARPADLVLASTNPTAPVAESEPEEEIVTRLSTSGGHLWGINLGRYPSRYDAEKVLLRTALSEMATLDGTLRKVAKTNRGFEANFLGMTRENADLACRRLAARNVSCFMVGPSS